MNIFSSATKIVLLIMVISFCALTFIGKIDPKDFVSALLMVLSFYYGAKSNNNINNQ